MTRNEAFVELDLNNVEFQENLFGLAKVERHAATETLKKLRRMTWQQAYADNGLKWEKIVHATLPKGVSAIYSLRLSQSRRATAYRDGNIMRLLHIRRITTRLMTKSENPDWGHATLVQLMYTLGLMLMLHLKYG